MRSPFTLTRFGMLIAGAALFAVPVAISSVLGLLWLLDRGLVLLFAGTSGLAYLAGWMLWRRGTARQKLDAMTRDGERIGPEPFWSPFDLEVWRKVQDFSDLLATGARDVDSYADLRQVLEDLLEMVSSAYHPYSDEARLEVKLSHVLLVSEQASRDLRELLVENVPLQSAVTVNEILKARKTFNFLARTYDWYRAVRPFANPASALVSELRMLASGTAVEQVSKNTTSWILARVAEGAGKHLINLYSGQVYPEQAKEAAAAGHAGAPSPELGQAGILRILILGQVKAGKSSLINALFGEVRTISHHLPETQGFLHFEKELEGVGKVQLIDSPGYGEAGDRDGTLARIARAMRAVDMIVLVSAAHQAGRSPDFEIARSLRALAEEDPKATVPPLVVAVSHVDRLRPIGRWSPPYNLADPSAHADEEGKRKAESIRDCVSSVADELGLDPALVVPVYAEPGHPAYNMDELALAIGSRLPAARTALLRRLLKEYHDDQYWESLKVSIRRSGKLVLRSSLESAIKGIRTLSDIIGRPGR